MESTITGPLEGAIAMGLLLPNRGPRMVQMAKRQRPMHPTTLLVGVWGNTRGGASTPEQTPPTLATSGENCHHRALTLGWISYLLQKPPRQRPTHQQGASDIT